MSARRNYPKRRSNKRYKKSYSKNKHRRNIPYLRKGTIVYVLDRLKHGGIDRKKHGWNPICQVIESPSFNLYEVEYEKGATFKLQEKIKIIGKGGVLGKIKRRLRYEDLTLTAMEMLEPVLFKIIKNNEEKYVAWINKAGAITIRRHYLELLPGVGKKLMNRILEERRKEEFKDMKDLHKRVSGFNPIKAIGQRILKEMEDDEVKHHIFIRKKKKSSQKRDNQYSKKRGHRNDRYSRRRRY